MRRKEDVYFMGDPVAKPDVLRKNCLQEIETLEGQAQFIGQWAVDLYCWKYRKDIYGDDDIFLKRIRRMATIICCSGYRSDGTDEVIKDAERKAAKKSKKK